MNSGNRLFFLVTQAELWMYSKVTEHLAKAGVDYSIIAMPNLELSHLTLRQSAQLNQEKLLESGIKSVVGVSEKGSVISPLKIARDSIVVIDQPNLELGVKWHPFIAVRRFRLAYSAYGIKLNTLQKWNFNQVIHKKGWAVFAESEWHLKKLLEYNPKNGPNFHLTGSPKIQALRDSHTGCDLRDGRPVILWAPHWSIGIENFVRYGTFDSVFPAMLKLAKDSGRLHFVMRAHQRLDRELRVTGKTLQDFIDSWTSLPNCSVSQEAAYQKTLAGAASLITDSESFIAEFSSLGKQLILIRRKDSSGYNDFGEQILSQQKTLEFDTKDFNQEQFLSSLKILLDGMLTNNPVSSELFPQIDSSGEIAQILIAGLRK